MKEQTHDSVASQVVIDAGTYRYPVWATIGTVSTTKVVEEQRAEMAVLTGSIDGALDSTAITVTLAAVVVAVAVAGAAAGGVGWLWLVVVLDGKDGSGSCRSEYTDAAKARPAQFIALQRGVTSSSDGLPVVASCWRRFNN